MPVPIIATDPNRPARLVAGLHAPRRATVAECLERWAALDDDARARSFLVLEGDEPGLRRTLNAGRIAELAARLHPPARRAA